jgi:malate dehydrogenase (oxaloacetate-decarboxylating)
MSAVPSAQYSLTIRVEIADRPGMLGLVASTIGAAGGSIGAIDLVEVKTGVLLRDITVIAAGSDEWDRIVGALRAIDGVEVIDTTDRTFMLHMGGKIEQRNKSSLKTRDDLSMAYTPGVARVCQAIADDPDKAFQYTIKRNTVAVVSDGTAVLGLGDIGPRAAMPVMEGKAMLFKEFAGVDAFPICLDTKDPDEIVRTVRDIAPVFGGINLEDISAPRCFEIERRLRDELDIPVFHDDQHGTAIVVLAALLNALRVVEKDIGEIRVVTTGCGAAGMAVTRILQAAGVRWIVGCDEGGALYRGRPGLNDAKREYAETTNPDNVRGTADELLEGADVFIGLSVPGAITAEGVRRMAPRAIVFAMANPNPEVDPETIEDCVEVIATGRSDYPNQINNVLAFPGVFRGALDVRARTIDAGMELAAAGAIAATIADDELSADYIVPSVFNRAVAPAVAQAVAEAAAASGVARRPRATVSA